MQIKTKIIDIIAIFLICFPFHFMYDWFPNTLFSIFFPVNESIFEHMKMLTSAIIFYGIIKYIILKKTKINNYLISLFITSLIATPIFLIIYLPIYNITGENMTLNLIVLFITITIVTAISYYIQNQKNIQNLNTISIIGITLIYIIFGILTYYPPINDLFYDKTKEKYGIDTYNI